MNTVLLFDFSVNKENKTVTVKKEFAAELPLVWDAWTTQELLDQWWAPKPWKARTKKMEFKEGGERLYAMVSPEGEEHWSIIRYKTIENQKRFTALDGFTDAEGNINPAMPQSNWEVKFTPNENSTLVEINITHEKLSDLETIIQMGFQGGFTMTLHALDELLAKK